MYISYLDFVVASLGAGYLTFVLVFSGIGDPVRRMVKRLCFSRFVVVSWLGNHISALLRCPFCTGFWVCAVVQLLYRINPLHGCANSLAGVVLTTPAMAILAAFAAFAAGKVLEALPEPVRLD